jgi:hypothetical protein
MDIFAVGLECHFLEKATMKIGMIAEQMNLLLHWWPMI